LRKKKERKNSYLYSKKKDQLVDCELNYFKEVLGGAALDRPVLDLGLLAQVIRVLDRILHTLNGEESGQVGSVRRYKNKSEKGPDATYDPDGRRDRIYIRTFFTCDDCKILEFFFFFTFGLFTRLNSLD
jgi:hypothetical protein